MKIECRLRGEEGLIIKLTSENEDEKEILEMEQAIVERFNPERGVNELEKSYFIPSNEEFVALKAKFPEALGYHSFTGLKNDAINQRNEELAQRGRPERRGPPGRREPFDDDLPPRRGPGR